MWTTPTTQLNLSAYLVAGFPLFPISHRFLFSSLLEKSGAEWNGSRLVLSTTPQLTTHSPPQLHAIYPFTRVEFMEEIEGTRSRVIRNKQIQ